MPSCCSWFAGSRRCSMFLGLILLASRNQCLHIEKITCHTSHHSFRISTASDATQVEICGAHALQLQQNCRSKVRHEWTCQGNNEMAHTRDQEGLRAAHPTLRLRGAGIIWREYFTSATLAANASICVCFGCGTHIATTSDVISRSFQVRLICL